MLQYHKALLKKTQTELLRIAIPTGAHVLEAFRCVVKLFISHGRHKLQVVNLTRVFHRVRTLATPLHNQQSTEHQHEQFNGHGLRLS